LRNAHDLIEQGQRAYARNDLVAAGLLLKEALAINPIDATATVLYAVVCARTGKRSIAIEYLLNVLRRDPNHFEAHVAISTLLFAAGKPNEALFHGQRAIEIQPEEPEVYCNVGRDLAKHGQIQESIAYFQKSIELSPGVPAYHLELAAAMAGSGRLQESAESWQRLLSLQPSATIGLIGLGRVRLALFDFPSAEECGRKAVEIDNKSADAHMLLALAASGMGNVSEAEQCLRRALEINLKQPFAHGLLGWLLQEKGCFEAARPLLIESLQVSPTSGIAYYALNRTQKATEDDRTGLSQLQRLADDPNIGLIDRSYMYYALAKAREDLGDYEASMTSYDAANQSAGAVWFDKMQWDRESYIRTFDRTIELFTPEYFDGRDVSAIQSATPLIVIGMIRSGTTLVEQILSSHPAISAGGELTFWHDHADQAVDLELGKIFLDAIPKIAQDYLETLRQISSSTQYVTDKLPHNYAMLGIVHTAFPNARIIHVRRNALDNCLSIYTTPYGHPPIFTLYRENIVCAYLQYLRMVAHWRAVLPSNRFLEIDYEDLVSNREAVSRKLIDFVDLEWSPTCLHHEHNQRIVNTPSAWQVRQPIYNTSVERWRRFEPWLGAFEELRGLG